MASPSANAIASTAVRQDEVDSLNLIQGRQRRSNAGSRMQALIETEFEREDRFLEEENDGDFFGKDEEDQFDEDFESTDEEAVVDGEDPTERDLQKEEKASRKATKVSYAKGKRVLRYDPHRPPTTSTSQTSAVPRRQVNRRVSLGIAFDAKTGEALEAGLRQSQRATTVKNKQEVQIRLKDALERRASVNKKPKLLSRLKTQDELIAEALDMEERNIHDLKHWMEREEEKKRKARVIRQSVQGPTIRWVSKAEDVKVRKLVEVIGQESEKGNSDKADPELLKHPPSSLPPQTPASAPQLPATYSSAWTPAAPSYRPHPYPFPPGQYPPPTSQYPYPAGQHTAQHPYPHFHQYAGHFFSTIPGHYSYAYAPQYQPYPQTPAAAPAVQPSSPPRHTYTKEKQAKNYVSIRLDHAPITWAETMMSLFGDQVDWAKLTVVPVKNRPAVHRLPTCPITGLPAPYLDPKSGVPYANARAYRTVQKLLRHEYIWSEEIGCYVGGQEAAFVHVPKVPEVTTPAVVDPTPSTGDPELPGQPPAVTSQASVLNSVNIANPPTASTPITVSSSGPSDDVPLAKH